MAGTGRNALNRIIAQRYVLKQIHTASRLGADFLCHAIFVPPGEKAPAREIIKEPNVFIYIDGFGNKPGDIGTIKLINDTPKLYAMQYNGDYGFDDFLAQGGAKSSDELAEYLMAYISKGFYKPKVAENSGGGSTNQI